jgi:hypothetical protein
MKPLRPPCGKCAGVAVALALLLSVPAALAERAVVYRWLDESGVAHYTTQQGRIPREFRDSAQEVGQGPAVAPPSLVRTPPPAATPNAPDAPAAAPPPVAAPPPAGPRVMPQGEFEEPPLGSRSSAPAATTSTASTPPVPAPPSAAPPAPVPPADPAPAQGHDVAAPPPGFIRGAPGPASASAAPSGPRASAAPVLEPMDDAALDDRIAALEDEVGRDQAALQNILSQPRESDGPRVADRPDFREIAQRLPKLQADLKAMREQRTRQGL